MTLAAGAVSEAAAKTSLSRHTILGEGDGIKFLVQEPENGKEKEVLRRLLGKSLAQILLDHLDSAINDRETKLQMLSNIQMSFKNKREDRR